MKRLTILLLVASVIPVQLTAQDTQQAKNKAIQPNSVVNVPNDCSVVAGNVQSLTVDFLDEPSEIKFSSEVTRPVWAWGSTALPSGNAAQSSVHSVLICAAPPPTRVALRVISAARGYAFPAHAVRLSRQPNIHRLKNELPAPKELKSTHATGIVMPLGNFLLANLCRLPDT